jgi:hypothetical protein
VVLSWRGSKFPVWIVEDGGERVPACMLLADSQHGPKAIEVKSLPENHGIKSSTEQSVAGV